MDITSSDNLVLSIISQCSKDAAEYKQVAKRMKELLPEVLAQVESKQRLLEKAGRSKRLALASKEYAQAIGELSIIQEKAVTALVNAETHRMLIKARQSLNSFAKIAKQKGFTPASSVD